jgi:RNA polymerase sigma factor for flagellar operon FliA
MVQRIALNIRGHLPGHVEVDDLRANGLLGLVDAAAKFNPAKGVKFDTYARHRVRGAILDGLRKADPISRELRRKNKRIQSLYHELEGDVGRPVGDEEMARALGVNLDRWHQSLNEIQSIGCDSGSRILTAAPAMSPPSCDPELLPDYGENPFDSCHRREQTEILKQALSTMPDRERRIIILYYLQGLTMKDIALRLHVDESRISQIHSLAMGRLKASVHSLLNPRKVPAPSSSMKSMAAGAGA